MLDILPGGQTPPQIRCPANGGKLTLGHKTGLWALETDVQNYRAARRRQRELAKRELDATAALATAEQPTDPGTDMPPAASTAIKVDQTAGPPCGEPQSAPTSDPPDQPV